MIPYVNNTKASFFLGPDPVTGIGDTRLLEEIRKRFGSAKYFQDFHFVTVPSIFHTSPVQDSSTFDSTRLAYDAKKVGKDEDYDLTT